MQTFWSIDLVFFTKAFLDCFLFMKLCTHIENSSMFVPKKYQFFWIFWLFFKFTVHERAYELVSRNFMSSMTIIYGTPSQRVLESVLQPPSLFSSQTKTKYEVTSLISCIPVYVTLLYLLVGVAWNPAGQWSPTSPVDPCISVAIDWTELDWSRSDWMLGQKKLCIRSRIEFEFA